MLWYLSRRSGGLPRAQSELRTCAVGLGLHMELDLGRLTDCLTYAFGVGENDVEAAFRCLAGPEPVVLDVGANIGTATLAFARLRPLGRVYAFEPSASMRTALAKNLALNRPRNVQIVPLALGNAAAKSHLKAAMPLNPGSAYVSNDATVGDDEPIDVVRLDDWLAADVRVDFIKLDVEGFELRALKGAAGTLRRSWPDLIFEMNEEALARAGTSGAELLEWITSLGYKIHELERGRIVSHRRRPDDDGRLLNLIAVNPQRRGQ